MALYVHLMVYMGLSLFIIRQALLVSGCMCTYVYNLTLSQETLQDIKHAEVERGEVNTRDQLKRNFKQRFVNHKDLKGRPKITIFSGKSDVKSAFRILGLSRDSWKWMIMKARDPMTKTWKYFVDKCLPFGSSISCALFQCFSDALRHITEHRLQVRNRITNYLDDFLFMAITIFFCNYMMNQFLNLCKELGIPVSLEKAEWASDLMIFLGILLNRSDMSLVVLLEK